MNNEKQHSEYKIIETIVTPTFDGVSVETHPEDQLGGGDTPKQETLFAIEFEAGKFAFGHGDENEIFLATKDGFSLIWYADADGVVTGNTEHGGMVYVIIDAYNEHFGTNIDSWESEKETLQVGDTVPNWNAYEKIEISSRKIALNMQSTSPKYIFGTIEGNILHLEVGNNQHSWYADTEGEILDNSGPGIEAKTLIIEQFGNKGISISDVVANIMQYDEGDMVPNWSEYEKIV